VRKLWTDRAWNDYVYWQVQDKKILRRVNELIKDIERNGYVGIGKPEPLKGNLAGWWSRRIDDTHRLVDLTLAVFHVILVLSVNSIGETTLWMKMRFLGGWTKSFLC